MSFEGDLETYLRACFTLICVVSHEEESIEAQVKSLCNRTKRSLLVWDHADYFQQLAGSIAPPNAKDSLAALEAIEKLEGDCVILLRDFHQCWEKRLYSRICGQGDD